ncbi:hypothetical protein GXB81_31015 [Paraburkholderia sp. Ac-20336]|uniref:hypothetical protein n=1 Tax=Paraburkholderia sp. Ac-20336 TaxID=2703886 RepID=UPI001980C974|nr:hypothetical protein [Paraburkholderia sp. Ac-20336]MBN3807427.1 hypothetical protein [Paraburkholderia sp. Ac-20336]
MLSSTGASEAAIAVSSATAAAAGNATGAVSTDGSAGVTAGARPTTGSADACATDPAETAWTGSLPGASLAGLGASTGIAACATSPGLTPSTPRLRARLTPAISVQRAVFSAMLRSVSSTLAGSATFCEFVAECAKPGAGLRVPDGGVTPPACVAFESG